MLHPRCHDERKRDKTPPSNHFCPPTSFESLQSTSFFGSKVANLSSCCSVFPISTTRQSGPREARVSSTHPSVVSVFDTINPKPLTLDTLLWPLESIGTITGAPNANERVNVPSPCIWSITAQPDIAIPSKHPTPTLNALKSNKSKKVIRHRPIHLKTTESPNCNKVCHHFATLARGC
jgi:hypothetical protein